MALDALCHERQETREQWGRLLAPIALPEDGEEAVSESMTDGWRNVGCAVIARAVIDAEMRLFWGTDRIWNPVTRKHDEWIRVHHAPAQAVHFLTKPSADLAFWCSVAGLEMASVIASSRKKYAAQMKRLQLPRLKFAA